MTFVTESGTEYDVVRKSWGYYATPSLNARLPSFGLKPALVRSGERLYLLLVESMKEEEFHAYLRQQAMEIVCWLEKGLGAGGWGLDKAYTQNPSAQSDVPRSPIPNPAPTLTPAPCLLCGSTAHVPVFTYDTPPVGETSFPLHAGEIYHREIWQCQGCRHLTNRHQLDLKRLYEGGYVDATYSGDKLLATFQKIMALPPERSDNCQRVQRIVRYMNEKRDRREREIEIEGGERAVSVSFLCLSAPSLPPGRPYLMSAPACVCSPRG